MANAGERSPGPSTIRAASDTSRMSITGNASATDVPSALESSVERRMHQERPADERDADGDDARVDQARPVAAGTCFRIITSSAAASTTYEPRAK